MAFIAYLLVFIHFVLFVWGIGGVAELILPEVPWPTLFNPDFPRWLLPIHYGTLLFASSGFLFGYFTRWKMTPQFMALAYVLLALLCVVETFGFMTSDSKYIALIAELIAYSGILYLLFKSNYFVNYFQEIK